MATIRIKLHSSVGADTSLVVGDQGRVVNTSHILPREAPHRSSQWRGGSKAVPSSAGILVITPEYQSFDQETFRRWNWSVLAQLADLIEKGKVIVELDTVAQTALQVRTTHIAV